MQSTDIDHQQISFSTIHQPVMSSNHNGNYYTAYGLNIYSVVELPELVATGVTSVIDVVIKREPIITSPLRTENVAHCFQCTTEGMYIYWDVVGTFLIRQGQEIVIDAPADLDEAKLRLFILGAAMGVLLHQRGFLVLHGSSVVIDHQAIMFIGDKRWGKSTMAASLNRRGHSLLGDDVMAIDLSNPLQPYVLPAFPQIKLWPDAVESLGENPDNLPQLVPETSKRNHRLKEGFLTQKIPLQQIFVLGLGREIEIASLEPQEILYYLLRNVYVTRFGEELIKHNRPQHFAQITQLMSKIDIVRLLRPQDLSLLPAVAELVEEQVRHH